jgi:two-component system response regulator HydG
MFGGESGLVDVRKLREEEAAVVSRPAPLDRIVGTHPSIERIVERVGQVAPGDLPVVLVGEPGTGKALVASVIHDASDRRGGPFVRFNAAALPEESVDGELFGSERGAVHGGRDVRPGALERADHGTLFIEALPRVPLAAQQKLARFLASGELSRLGGTDVVPVDARVVVAASSDPSGDLAMGEIDADLHAMLGVVTMQLPPLRSHKSDVALLAYTFLRRFARASDRSIRGFTDDTLSRLVEYGWPGNVRELEATIERAVVMAHGELIDTIEIPDAPQDAAVQGELAVMVPGASMADVERYVILKTLEAVSGSTSKAAHMLGISTRKIQYRLKRWGVSAKDYRHGDREQDARTVH